MWLVLSHAASATLSVAEELALATTAVPARHILPVAGSFNARPGNRYTSGAGGLCQLSGCSLRWSQLSSSQC